jgi:hypothetical protein
LKQIGHFCSETSSSLFEQVTQRVGVVDTDATAVYSSRPGRAPFRSMLASPGGGPVSELPVAV